MCIKSLIPQTGKRSEKCQKLVYLKGIYNVHLVNCVKLVKLIKLGNMGRTFKISSEIKLDKLDRIFLLLMPPTNLMLPTCEDRLQVMNCLVAVWMNESQNGGQNCVGELSSASYL